ncbi:2-oxoglutarate carboxylase large subunit [Variovorax sp. SRS16]|uniref:pyruvate carboxylase subunit B n=1 Tax=Variovorax sp. SRS16 TaxID=282217 RepID=UPI00131950C7|nr:pyruvate carboxylase subunit B [Variovorax sp. SRS16]VTU22163.1 2-oxoglutarate carboxylase large subunit [Variovorax sp. SRS16]
MKQMKFMDITLRDAQQCLWATRMTTSEMTPIAETMDNAGFSVIDLTGGAAIDSAMMYLAEDPFERIRVLSGLITKTPLNFNTRGQSIFRWMQYADDVTEFTLEVMRRNGIRSVMVFDALNDMRNLEYSVKVAKRLDMHIIGAVTYTVSPVHTDAHFVQRTKDLVALGVHALEIKDPSGLLTPERVAHLIPALRKVTPGLELQLRSHCTLGHGLDTYLETLKLGENGVDLMHTASRPLAYGYSLPSHDAILDALPAHGYGTPVDRAAIDEMQSYFSMLTRRSGRPEGKVLPVQSVDEGHQVPGGMMSNLVQQLTDQGQAHRLPEVLDEIVRVREDLGYPILVSPMAQYVGTQGVLNVLSGKRYQMVPQEIKQYVLGYYGKVVGTIDPQVRELIAGDEKEIDVPPGQTIEPAMARYRRELGPCASDEELALKIFYSAKTVEDNRVARLNVGKWTHATNAAALLAKELLGKKNIEVCEVRKKDFYFSANHNDSAAATVA